MRYLFFIQYNNAVHRKKISSEAKKGKMLYNAPPFIKQIFFKFLKYASTNLTPCLITPLRPIVALNFFRTYSEE
jgi:hypothetical protein